MEISLTKTLAGKHKTSVMKILDQYKTKVMSKEGQRKCLEVTVQRNGKRPLVARFGGIPFTYRSTAEIQDGSANRITRIGRSELLQRLFASECEVCKETKDCVDLEVHHVRKLADLNKPGQNAKPLWMKVMSARRRKTIVLCGKCHDDLHAGRPLNFK